MRTKICLLLLAVTLLMTGCTIAKETSREVELVNAIVTGVDYDPPFSRPVMVGKIMTIHCTPADYDVFVEYEGLTLTIDDRNLYEMYENRIGDTIQVKKVTIYYDNGDMRQRLERSD